MFANRNKITSNAAKEIAANQLKGEEASRKAEEDITEQLFATEIAVDSGSLKTQKDYVNFAKQVSKVLYEGQAGYNIPSFF